MKNKAILLTPLFLALILLPSVIMAGEFDGKWIAEVKESTSSCKNLGKNFEPQYVVYLKQQEGNTITATVEFNGNVFHGIRQAANLNHLHLMGSFLKDAGIVTKYFDLEMSDSDAGTGGAVWSWSNGMYNCGGSYNFTMERAKD